jgi:hypothetical protein
MNGYGNIQDELYKRVENALIYPCPYSADFRVNEWRADLYTDIERVYNTLKPFKDNKNLIDYALRFYVEHRRRYKLGPNYWSTVQEFAKYERLKNALNKKPIIKICSYSASAIVKQWQLIWYDSPHSRHTHTEKQCLLPKLSNPDFERKYPEKPLRELQYIGPYLITEWPGVSNKRKYTNETPGYNTVIDSLLCAIEGKLGAIRFNTPPMPKNTRSENVNGIADELRPFYLSLRKNAAFADAYATTSFVIDLFGLPEELKDRDRFLNRISAPQKNNK